MKRYFAFTSLSVLSGILLSALLSVGMPVSQAQAQAQKNKQAKPKKDKQAQDPKKPSASPDCPRSDNEIIKDMYEKLKADPQLKKQYRQVNITSEKESFKLTGWVLGGDTAKKKFVALVSSVACVNKPVDAKELSIQIKSGCNSLTEDECGNGCVPKGTTCNVPPGR